MGRSPNQKHIVYHKPQYHSDFTIVDKQGWYDVAKLSNSKAVLILYLYMVDNKDLYEEDLSTSYLSDLFGMDRKTWQRAIDVLVQEGYLVHRQGEASNNYDFFPKPKKETTINLSCKLKDFARMDEVEQQRIYEAILKIDWGDMTEDQIKIHDYYVENILEV